MAKMKIEVTEDGALIKTLEFAGRIFMERMTPFEGGISRGLDRSLDAQVEDVFPGIDVECLELLCDVCDDPEDYRDRMVDLAEWEDGLQ